MGTRNPSYVGPAERLRQLTCRAHVRCGARRSSTLTGRECPGTAPIGAGGWTGLRSSGRSARRRVRGTSAVATAAVTGLVAVADGAACAAVVAIGLEVRANAAAYVEPA